MFPFDFFADFLTRNSLTRFFSFFFFSEAEVNFLSCFLLFHFRYTFDPFFDLFCCCLVSLGFFAIRLGFCL